MSSNKSYNQEVFLALYGHLIGRLNADDMTIDPNFHSQPLMPIVDAGTNFGKGSSNVSQSEYPQQMMTSSSGVTPGGSIDPLHGSGQNILSSAVKTLSNHTAQTSQSHTTNFNQLEPQQATQTYHNQPLMQQAYNNSYVQQPQTQSSTNQSNIAFDDQMTNRLRPSNQLLSGTVAMTSYTQTGNVQSDQIPWVQMQQHPTQNPSPSQQATGALIDLISLGGQQQQGISNNGQHKLRAPVGFATPQQFSSSDEYREYVVRQGRYYIKLQHILSDEMQRYAQAKTVEDSQNHKSMKAYLETMLRFLSITNAGSIPGNDQTICDYMNVLVNFMACYMRGRSGCCSQNCEPVNQLLNEPSVQLSNQSQVATNVETNIVNFNSRIPVIQQSRMPSSLNNTSCQIGIDRRPENPARIGPSIVSPPTGLIPKQQTNSGPNTSSVLGSGSPIGFVSSSEKVKQHKQSMNKTNEFTYPRVRGLSPLGPGLASHFPPNQLPVPSSAVASQTFDVNSMLTPQAIARSPFLPSSSSTPQSGMSLVPTVENQKLASPTNSPCQEPQTSKDPIHYLAQVVKSISPKALSSSLTDISTMEKGENIMPDCIPTNLIGQFINIDADNEPCQNMRQEASIPSMLNNQFDLSDDVTYLRQIKKPKLENKWALFEEIKDINSRLMETIVYEELDPSKANITLLGGHDDVILKCLYRNVRFPDLLGPYGQKMPEFPILFFVPFDYPATSTRIFKTGKNAFKSEVCRKLYEKMITRFSIVTRGILGKLCVRELASKWDASACAVMSEYSQELGGKSFSSRYGSWESCLNGSSSSN